MKKYKYKHKIICSCSNKIFTDVLPVWCSKCGRQCYFSSVKTSLKKQTVYTLKRGYKLEFYEGDTAGTYCWDLMYKNIVLADAKDKLFSSLSAAKKNFKITQRIIAKFNLEEQAVIRCGVEKQEEK